MNTPCNESNIIKYYQSNIINYMYINKHLHVQQPVCLRFPWQRVIIIYTQPRKVDYKTPPHPSGISSFASYFPSEFPMTFYGVSMEIS